ncbi:hypothetical protein ZWY2020_008406 [Hordeum vulgare]|nr:hypothetical protein ZWY2020_008406 [Hordeum vulgare]
MEPRSRRKPGRRTRAASRRGPRPALLGLALRDYEYASFNPVAFDIANHFCEMAADYHSDTPHVMDLTNTTLICEEPSDAEVETLLGLIAKYSLASHLFWGRSRTGSACLAGAAAGPDGHRAHVIGVVQVAEIVQRGQIRSFIKSKVAAADCPGMVPDLDLDLDDEAPRRGKKKGSVRSPFVGIVSKQMVSIFLTIWVQRGLRRRIFWLGDLKYQIDDRAHGLVSATMNHVERQSLRGGGGGGGVVSR